MPDGTTQQPERLSPAQIRTAVLSGFEAHTGWVLGVANSDTKIVKKNLSPVLEQVSERIGRKVILNGTRPKPKRGWRFTVASLTTHIWEHQAHFEPIPQKPQDQNPESTECL